MTPPNLIHLELPQFRNHCPQCPRVCVLSSPKVESLITLQHTLDQIAQWAPVVFAAALLEPMLIDEQDVMFEAGVQVRFETQMHDDLVVVTIDVRVDSVESLEQLSYRAGEVFREWDADTGREGGFIVDVGLYPRHEVFNVFWSGHLCRFGIACRGVLPEVFESEDHTLVSLTFLSIYFRFIFLSNI